ncbi:MAG TPA: helicase C-terminal domain-containing protein [Rariglobus sp.]|jgi:Rad3-related DNA helicase|nr:helicase C-terminal domain-containing protein [Rariglobus sp.]
MDFDLDQRTASLSIGEFAGFTIGPRESTDGPQGLWRAQLGTRWHQELRSTTGAATPAATFEIPVTGRVFHAGWTLTLTGRIDQLLPATSASPAILREIKTTLRPLPAAEEELRADHPDYFAQLATYLALRHIADPSEKIRGELVFVEAGSGFIQTLAFTSADEAPFRVQLERVAEFLNLRLRARDRLRTLTFLPAFTELRAGQETTQAELSTALATHRRVLFTAPTGFGKTGVLLECALGAMKAGRYSRLLYLTSKSTGQLQVMRTLQSMTARDSSPQLAAATPVSAWPVRPKREHCVNHTFHCVRDNCAYIRDIDRRWARSGLSRFYLFENSARDLDALRAAGRDAMICPYEITRTALAFQDVWVGDYNYVFAPANRGLFFDQPGFNPAETLLVLDEAHNLSSRVADAYSHVLLAGDARLVLDELDHLRVSAPLLRSWESWTTFLAALPICDALTLEQEDDLADILRTLTEQLALHPPDYAALGPHLADQLWKIPSLNAWLTDSSLKKLLWSPHAGELRGTCLDASSAIGESLKPFGGVVFATATPGPVEAFAAACGLSDSSAQLSTPGSQLTSVTAHTPWRDNAYDIAYDIRVDTTYHQRPRYYAATAATIAALHTAAPGPVAVFFPSYAYAEAVERALRSDHPALRAAIQPRQSDLAAQSSWVDESLMLADALFLVLGSSFAEGIDVLGGRISHAMVVGPALPEVNAVQKARLAALPRLTREEAFRRVYQIPGMQKVNQALGRLVRAPGQRAKILLHCRRFAELNYAQLLDHDYQFGTTITTDAELSNWLG